MKNDIQRFSKAFYSSESIKRAIKDYKRIATITCSEEERYYVCRFSNCVIDTQKVINEFNNYLIELMNSRGANAEA